MSEPFCSASSDGVGNRDRAYHVGKYRVRKQWVLQVSTPNVIDFAAYFRTEDHARQFATTFGLTITEHKP